MFGTRAHHCQSLCSVTYQDDEPMFPLPNILTEVNDPENDNLLLCIKMYPFPSEMIGKQVQHNPLSSTALVLFIYLCK